MTALPATFKLEFFFTVQIKEMASESNKDFFSYRFFFLNITHLDSTVALLSVTEREAAAVIIRVAVKEQTTLAEFL